MNLRSKEFELESLQFDQNTIKELESEVQELRKQIQWMENSKFWRLRNFLIRIYSIITFKQYQVGSGSRNKYSRKKSDNLLEIEIYQTWLKDNIYNQSKFKEFEIEISKLNTKPTISILYLYNEKISQNEIVNFEKQIYCAHSVYSVSLSSGQAKEDFIYENVIQCSNLEQFCELNNSEFTLVIEQGNSLELDILYHFVRCLNEFGDKDIIYSDNDFFETENHFVNPYFKPQFSPDSLLERNYIGNVFLLKTSILKKAISQLPKISFELINDILIRSIAFIKNAERVPKILFHTYGFYNPFCLKQSNLGDIDDDNHYKMTLINSGGDINNIGYLVNGSPKVSIIIPCKNQSSVTTVCLNSIFSKSTYTNFEVILVDNNSTELAFKNLMTSFKKKEPDRFKCISYSDDFNFSKIINFAAKNSSGEYLLLLNNDTEVVTPQWIEYMLGQSQRQSIGVVGVKLLYPNKKIQHVGVTIGLDGIAGHPLVGCDRSDSNYFYYSSFTNNVSAVTAACCMVKRNVFDLVEGFDEELTVEYNDVDFCLRVKELGYNNVFIPYVELIHYESLSRGDTFSTELAFQRHVKESSKFKLRWPDYILDDPCYNVNMSRDFNRSYMFRWV